MSNVAVTGIGLVTPLGLGREKVWRNLLGSKSAVKNCTEFPDILSAKIEDYDVPGQLRLLSMGFLACAEALRDSGINIGLIERGRFGCTVSVSKPNLDVSDGKKITLNEAFFPSFLGDRLYRIFDLGGPVRNVAAACATGTDSIILGAQWIELGLCDAVIAGAAESSLNSLYISGFKQMGVLAHTSVRPFDRFREGFAIGEGAGVVVLERKDSAVMRGAHVYGEISGWSISCDTAGSISPKPDGNALMQAILKAVKMSEVNTVEYINAHGTATVINDLLETNAITKAFGRDAAKISVSSTKAATGHLLGACGAVETGFCLLALRDQVVPPTLNISVPDENCSLDYTPNFAKNRTVNTAMNLSLGFGGQIGVIVVRK